MLFWSSCEEIQIAVKRREVKSKREKERYKHLNAELQRIARRDKKAFLRDQCKEIEENKRMLCLFANPWTVHEFSRPEYWSG